MQESPFQIPIGTTTHQGAWDGVVANWHDVNYEQLFFLDFSNLHTLQHIIMSDKNLVEKLRRIFREKEEECRILIH